MKKIIFLLLFLTATLSAQGDDVQSNLVIEGESYTLNHELQYGLSNSYSFLVAEHQIHAEGCLLFYYGTKVGLVFEDYASPNGFGPTPDQYGIIIKANAGIKYSITDYQQLSFEGSHTQEQIHHDPQSKVNIAYNYSF